MDESYFAADYIDFHYFNYTARAASSMTAFDLVQCMIRVIHITSALTYKIKQETRQYKIREETRLRSIAEETRVYKIKEN